MLEIDKCIRALAAEILPEHKIDVAVEQDSKHGVLATINLFACKGELKKPYAKSLANIPLSQS